MASSTETSDREGTFALLLTASTVSSLIMLDSNVVAVSLPAIARSLHATFADIEWVVSSYVLTFSALLLAAGSFCDRHGRKLSTLIGLAVFTVASGLCGLATTAIVLNVARALQGVGASLLLTATMAIINNSFSGPARARAFSFWGACLGIAITSGPILGGVMTDYVGWRWSFLMNLPIGIILFVSAVIVLPESRDPDSKRLDVAGVLTFSGALFLLTWALIDGNALGWSSAAVISRIAWAVLLFGAFISAERIQERPMVDLALFRKRDFQGTAFAMLGYAGGAQVMIFYLPLFLQNAYGMAPARAGLAMIPFALPMFLTPRLSAGLSSRYSSRALLVVGLATAAVGDLSLQFLARVQSPYALFAVGMVVVGAGAGLLNSETSKAMQGAVPAQRSGMGSGLTSTTRFTGLLLAVASLGATLSSHAASRFASLAGPIRLSADQKLAITARIASGDVAGSVGSLSGDARSQIALAASAAFAHGFAVASLGAASIAATTGILTFVFLAPATNLLPRPSQPVASLID